MADIDYSEIEQEAWRGWLEKSGMEKAISLGILGEPELRKDEKNRFLGEFEERSALGFNYGGIG
jgi:Fe-S cluster biosynthesis and repair protein YggX